MYLSDPPADDGPNETGRAIAEAVVGLVRRCLETGPSDAGAVVSRAAGRLLLSLMTAFSSSALERSPAVAALLKDSNQVPPTHGAAQERGARREDSRDHAKCSTPLSPFPLSPNPCGTSVRVSTPHPPWFVLQAFFPLRTHGAEPRAAIGSSLLASLLASLLSVVSGGGGPDEECLRRRRP